MSLRASYRIEIYEVDRGVEFLRDFPDETQLHRAVAILDDILGNPPHRFSTTHRKSPNFALTSAQWAEFKRRLG